MIMVTVIMMATIKAVASQAGKKLAEVRGQGEFVACVYRVRRESVYCSSLERVPI